jgi:hypothetical protein
MSGPYKRTHRAPYTAKNLPVNYRQDAAWEILGQEKEEEDKNVYNI